MFLHPTKNKKEKKARKECGEWLQLARKVYAYREDVLGEADRAALGRLIEEMSALLKDKGTPVTALRECKEAGEPLLRRCGGDMYPKRFVPENAEMLLFAAILAIGIRTFFFQPFKIPTNSMYPSYNGMTAEVYTQAEAAPSVPVQWVRLLALGARHYALEAPVSGELGISMERRAVPGRKWFVLPTQKLQYTFYVGDEPVTVDLPMEFDIRQVIDPLVAGGPREGEVLADGTRVLRTGIEVERGETAVAFDLLTGDQLFVDKISYHFTRPKVGDPIVFRTNNLENIDAANRDKYYIKRAVAGPGDRLRIVPPGLELNGEPAAGSTVFEANRLQEGEYPGYVHAQPSRNYARPFLGAGETVEIPQDHYFAMGDNSPNSADGRMWGFVPQEEIVGKAVFIYYPFSHRWGPSE